MFRATFVSALLLTLSLSAASAGNEETVYVKVQGATAGEIKADIEAKGIKVGGRVPFSFTVVKVNAVKPVLKSKGQCSFKSYRTKMKFIYVLPKLVSSKGLPPSTSEKWRAFSSYLARHEVLHKDNWTACFARIDEAAGELTASSCEALEKKEARLLNKRKLDCLANDRRIDDIYHRELWKDPFVKEAMSQSKGKFGALLGLGKLVKPKPQQ